MSFRLRVATDPLGKISRMLARVSHPQCHHCGSATRLLDILDQPVYGQPGKALAQYSCEACHTLVEELRPT